MGGSNNWDLEKARTNRFHYVFLPLIVIILKNVPCPVQLVPHYLQQDLRSAGYNFQSINVNQCLGYDVTCQRCNVTWMFLERL